MAQAFRTASIAIPPFTWPTSSVDPTLYLPATEAYNMLQNGYMTEAEALWKMQDVRNTLQYSGINSVTGVYGTYYQISGPNSIEAWVAAKGVQTWEYP